MIGLMLKYILPTVLMYLALKFIRNGIMGKAPSRGDTIGRRQAPSSDVIEICPDCGYEKKSRHRCREA